MACCNRYPVRVAWAVVGVVVGVSAGAAFGPVLNNIDACIFAFFSGLIAAVVLAVHIMYHTNVWRSDSFESLVFLKYFGCFIQLIGLTGIVVYIVLGALQNYDGLGPVHGRNFYLASIWCFMTLKWGFLLFYHCRRYCKELVESANEYHTIQN